MPIPLPELEADKPIPLPERDGLPASVHVIDLDSIEALRAALVTGRPLLVRGEPGTGKSQLARAAAVVLGRVLVTHAVDARTETRDLLWSVDAVARLAEAQVMGALHQADHDEVRKRIDVMEFLQPGPLWWAFDWSSAVEQAARSRASTPTIADGCSPERGVVVLIDEIDKADPSVPNALLDALGHGRFDVQGRGPVVMKRDCRPLVVITTNEERALPDAFLRRCFVLQLGLPEERDALVDALVNRGGPHFPRCSPKVLKEAAEQLATDREALLKRDLAAPGLAEFIDLVLAVTEQEAKEAKQLALLQRIAKFALQKHPPEHTR